MKILLDTNIIIDNWTKREPFYSDSQKVMTACTVDDVQACISALSVPNIFYILRKIISETDRRGLLKALCGMFDVIGIDRDKLIAALDDATFTDFEDCLQAECAADYGADYIITRNTKDFENSKVKAITPTEFLQLLSPNKEEQ